MPENFFVDETPAMEKESETTETKTTKKTTSKTTTSKLKNDIAPNNAGENSTKLPPASSRSVGEELTFEEEWKFGSRKGGDGGGGGGGEGEEAASSSKSGNLKADGDRITRRGVKRGPRKTKKTISIGAIKSASNDSTTTDSEQVYKVLGSCVCES